jgi:hypothetical protein
MDSAVLKLVSREGRIELELVDGSPEDRRELADLIAHSKDLLIQLDAVEGQVVGLRSKLTPAELEDYRKEGQEWLRAIAAGGAFDFWNNPLDDEVWNNA